MKPRFATTTMAVLMIVTGCGLGSSSSPSGSSVCNGSGAITIGVIAPISGAASLIVGAFGAGADQAASDINASGGICGGRHLQIVKKDNQSDFTQDAALAKELVENDHAVGIIVVADQDQAVIGSYAQSKGVLTVCACTSDAFDSPNNARDAFSVAIPNAIESQLWTQYLLKTKQVSHPGVLYETTSGFGAEQSDTFCNAAKANNTPCVATEQTTITTTDVTQQVGDLKTHGADSLLLEGFGDPVVATIKTARAAGINGPILGTATVATSSDLITAFVSAADRQGFSYVNYRSATHGDPDAATWFADELGKQGPVTEPLFVPMFAHDAVLLMARGWANSNSLNADAASKAIEKLNVKVAPGGFTLHDAVYSPQHHEPHVTGWLTLCSADALDTRGLATVSPDAASLSPSP